MIDTILKKSVADPNLVHLLDNTREYAEIYLMAKNRQKGCDGMGEAATLKEEFRDALENLIEYCVEHDYLPVNTKADYDILAREILRNAHERIT